MKKTARLDQILIGLGFVDEDQITRALHRQKSHGGRLGMNLVRLGAIDEEQLLTALSEQFRIPTLTPSEKDIREDLIGRMPAELVAKGLAIPLSWNEGQHVLSLAVVNPSDVETVRQIRDAFGAKAVRVALAPERHLANLGRRLVGDTEDAGERRIMLPELFAEESEEASEEQLLGVEEGRKGQPVVMVTSAASRKNFLPPVFQREGFELTVATTKEEASAALTQTDVAGVLLSKEMAEEFSAWVQQGGVPAPSAEVTVFSGVGKSLLENPLPYEMTVRSLRSSVQALADYRCAQLGVSPPYGLISTDVAALAEQHGLRRIASDALDLCTHLLLPAPLAPGSDPVGTAEPFGAFASSLELATRIRFPWRLDTVLAACHALYSARTDPFKPGKWPKEALVAAQILAIVWYRHNHLPSLTGGQEERMIALRTSLRDKGGVLARQEVIEGYLRLIAERGGVREDVGDRQVLLVGDERIERALAPALGRVGREALVTGDLADAQTMTERRPPAAIVLDHDEFPAQVDKFSRVAKLGGASLLFVLTDSSDPALVLNLLDIGVDDVFGPPHDFDLVAARINRAIRSRTRDRTTDKPQAGQFSATFEVFSFLDLIQMLSQGLKTVRIDLSRGDGDTAVIFMQKGRMTHATLGEHVGEEAVYRVIAWQDQGEFTVREESRFPPDTIEVSSESVLMEGCRLLDEATR